MGILAVKGFPVLSTRVTKEVVAGSKYFAVKL